jgi:hypothetical protein
MSHGLALTYTAMAAIGFSYLFGYRATIGNNWFEQFSLTEDKWRSAFPSYLYGFVYLVLVVHAPIIPVFCIFYFIDANVTMWVAAPISIGIAIGYAFSVIKLLDVFAKWLRVKGRT